MASASLDREDSMCVPGTIEAVRSHVDEVKEDAKAPRLDRRAALLLGAGTALAAAMPGGVRAAGPRGGKKAQDLTHLFRVGIPMFPGVPRPSRQTHVTVPVNGFYGQIWNFWEHTGTHLDVPAHFIVGGRTSPQLTLDELMARIAVVDISERAARNPDTVVTTDDLRRYERRHGRIKRGSLVAMNSGWDARASSEAAYRNTDSAGTMHFPGWSDDAIEWLIDERGIAAIGVDTLSLDPGNATAFVAHVALLSADRFGIENLANLAEIPPRGATAFVGVIPWEEGSGGPARVVATW
jgi:kynurenine formamidase